MINYLITRKTEYTYWDLIINGGQIDLITSTQLEELPMLCAETML